MHCSKRMCKQNVATIHSRLKTLLEMEFSILYFWSQINNLLIFLFSVQTIWKHFIVSFNLSHELGFFTGHFIFNLKRVTYKVCCNWHFCYAVNAMKQIALTNVKLICFLAHSQHHKNASYNVQLNSNVLLVNWKGNQSILSLIVLNRQFLMFQCS